MGGGARVNADGVDTGGIVFNTTPNIANIEEIEADFPLLYLFRRHLEDSGGAGRFRGGRSAELAYVAWRAPEGFLEGSFAGTGGEMPNAIGLSGGLPGAAIRLMMVSESGVHDALEGGEMPPSRLEDIPGRREVLPVKHPRRTFGRNEVWYHNWQGAAGYGDPITREPEKVADDLREGVISTETAERIYGLRLTLSGDVDVGGTASRREGIRRLRLEDEPLPAGGIKIPEGAHQITDDLWLLKNRVFCGRCGESVGGPKDPLALAKSIKGPLTGAGPVRGEAYATLYGTDRFFLIHHVCPGCGTQLEVRVAMEGAPTPGWRLSD